jgi:hypothetical protein
VLEGILLITQTTILTQYAPQKFRPYSGLERESATAGTYHETRKLSITFPAGGSGASNGAAFRIVAVSMST